MFVNATEVTVIVNVNCKLAAIQVSAEMITGKVSGKNKMDRLI
jgi:hypothetical protein